MKLLLKWGADPNIIDNDGVSAMMKARELSNMLALIHRHQVIGAYMKLLSHCVNMLLDAAM